jgi:hypothetical protein
MICDWCLTEKPNLRSVQAEPDKVEKSTKMPVRGRHINVCGDCAPKVARQLANRQREKEAKKR